MIMDRSLNTYAALQQMGIEIVIFRFNRKEITGY
jgi:hypothetical protein